jgi:muramoyltetrapeptide carboxypeptidase LdcA involved in peptidoglycan recycling
MASSDIAWAVWHRRMTGKLEHINGFIACSIDNKETEQLIRRALKSNDVPTWPGTTFDHHSPEYMALLGTFLYIIPIENMQYR